MNITLIGMTGAGKSTVGVELAARLSYAFYDVDREMEQRSRMLLQDILDELGDAPFLAEQAKQLIALGNIKNTVLAPGGSVVYSPDAMEYLQSVSTVVYLQTNVETVIERITVARRGVVGLQEKTFAELFAEREKLYRKYAHKTVAVEELSVEAIVEQIVHDL